MPDNDFARLLQLAYQAMDGVVGDPAIWDEELARTDGELLSWPLSRADLATHQVMLQMFCENAVQTVLSALEEHQGAPAGSFPALHGAAAQDPGFQVILRVCKRAVDSAAEAMCREFGGAGRVSGKRQVISSLQRSELDQLLRAGFNVTAAAQKLGMSKTAAYLRLKGK